MLQEVPVEEVPHLLVPGLIATIASRTEVVLQDEEEEVAAVGEADTETTMEI